MKFALTSFVALLAAAVANAQLQINTPANVVECLPQLITFSGGTPPYFVSALPGGQPSAAALVNFGQQNGTSLTWVVNLAAGTSVGLTIRDSTGATASSAPFTILSGDSSCVGSSASIVEGSSTVAVTNSQTAAASTTSGGSSSSGSSSTSGSSSSGSTSTSSASSSTSSSAAMPFAQIGSAGVLGAALVAIFA